MRFLAPEFEAALPQTFHNGPGCPWRYAGIEGIARVYFVRLGINSQLYIKVNSSIVPKGTGAADSVRASLIDSEGKPLSPISYKLSGKAGWQEDLMGLLRFIATVSKQIRACEKCKKDCILTKQDGSYILTCKDCNTRYLGDEAR